jgi:hypothetical protein
MTEYHSDDIWVLTFVPTGPSTAPMSVRVKRLLKCALRAFGLKCVRVSGLKVKNGKAGSASLEDL